MNKPFSKQDLAQLRLIVTATIAASPEAGSARSAKDVANFYMSMLLLVSHQYNPDCREAEVYMSYRELSGKIRSGQICKDQNGQVNCVHQAHTIAKYVRLLVLLGFAKETRGGFAIKVPHIDYRFVPPEAATRAPRKLFAPKIQPSPSEVKTVDPAEPPTTAAPKAEKRSEPYPLSEQIPEFVEYLRRHLIEAPQWSPLSVGEREAWFDRFGEVMKTQEYWDIAETVRAKQSESIDNTEPTILF
jgi:hypothetical protein